MKTLAYCAKSFEASVARAAGVVPLTCPPLVMDAFDHHWLEGYDFIYFKLHGLPSQPFWYGDDWLTALSEGQIRLANLSRTIIFVANCHLCERTNGDIIPSPMLTALLAAGARCVVGGPGTNYAAKITLVGADLLGYYFRLLVTFPRIDPQLCFRAARARVALAKDAIAADTLGFQYFTSDSHGRAVLREALPTTVALGPAHAPTKIITRPMVLGIAGKENDK